MPIQKQQRQAVIFGAGIAGLTAAHEFAARGYEVAVYEANDRAGGFYRSDRRPEDGGMPSEYSWHGIAPWYHNVFDILKQIPFDESVNMYDRILSRPIDFGLAGEEGAIAFDDTLFVNVKNMFRMTWPDVARGSWLMLKTWTADRRTCRDYADINAARAWRPLLTDLAYRTWLSCFGPWIGSDWTNVSLHTAGQFFRKQLITKPTYTHHADEEGPEWKHGARNGWLLLRGPSNEYWFDRWVAHLERRGVAFFWNERLAELVYRDGEIRAGHLKSGEVATGDIFVLAVNPFAAAEVLEKNHKLAGMDQLSLFKPLIRNGPHTQVSLRMAFAERVAWPRKRPAVIVADSEFNLTLFAQELAWDPEVNLGDGIHSLLTITACVATVPGRLYGKPLIKCTKDEFIEEVKAQLFACEGLNALIREANGGRGLADFPIVKIEVWHEWLFSPQGIQYHQPKWVNRIGNQCYMPTQATPVPNLVLAGAHTRTEVDVWSIEAAVESGRRAVKVIEPGVKVISQYRPSWLRWLQRLDNFLYGKNTLHVLSLLTIALLAGVFLTVFLLLL